MGFKNLIKVLPRFAIMALIISVFVRGIMNIEAQKLLTNYDFQGLVTDIQFDKTDNLTVIISGKSYKLLNVAYGFEKEIEIGDSLMKLKNEPKFTLIKAKTGIKWESFPMY